MAFDFLFFWASGIGLLGALALRFLHSDSFSAKNAKEFVGPTYWGVYDAACVDEECCGQTIELRDQCKLSEYTIRSGKSSSGSALKSARG